MAQLFFKILILFTLLHIGTYFAHPSINYVMVVREPMNGNGTSVVTQIMSFFNIYVDEILSHDGVIQFLKFESTEPEIRRMNELIKKEKTMKECKGTYIQV